MEMAYHRAADWGCKVTIVYSKPMNFLDGGTMQELQKLR
jgi:hypothetical protein